MDSLDLLGPNKEINFLEKPKIDLSKLNYIQNKKQVYANLYEIILKKPLKLYQYPYSVDKNIEAGDIRIREKLFKGCSRELRKIYGECFISGDSLFAKNKVEEAHDIKCSLYLKGKIDYQLHFQKVTKEKEIKQQDIHKDQLAKQFIELLIKDILHSNPKLEFYKGLFVLTNKKKNIETDRVSISFYPGFTTSFMETDSGNYLNVTLKNKIIQNDTVLDFLKSMDYHKKNNQQKIRDELKGRSFKVSYMKRNHTIDDIIFDRNPTTQTFTNEEGKTINLIDYYKSAHELEIEDKNQPLILVRKKAPQEGFKNLYFVPELCSLSGLEDGEAKDKYFMKELAKKTKLEPDDRVFKTNEFLDLLIDPEREKPKKNKNNKNKKSSEIRLSAKEKSELYGIEVRPLNQLFTAYYMKDTKLLAGNKKTINSKDRTFPVLEKEDMTSWLCFYEKNDYKNAENLYNTLKSAGKSYGFYIEEPEWIEMPNFSSAKDWTDTAEDYIGKGKKDYRFAVFLIGREDKKDSIYKSIKIHSLCTNGYVSQVVKARTLQNKRGLMSICSKILLQINAKIGGVSYKAVIDKQVKDRNLMVIGVDSSHIKGKGTGVAKVATINNDFTEFFNKEEIINEKNKEQLQYSISNFIREAIVVYNKKNKINPKCIIIYRQGVSLQQKEFLKTEIKEIAQECKNKNILFYYILVNTKTTFKFFEKSGNNYSNPGAGLIVIDGVTNKNFFEFYIQPQEVTQGSATPSCFHVAYGNLDIPEIIPKFTYDLCHIYSNWQGTVRIPNVIKAAEKLSKMTAKYTYQDLNKEVEIGQPYL